MKFKIKSWTTDVVMFTAEIEVAEDSDLALKLGLAVKWAFANKINLRGAHLQGAHLQGAHLQGADLQGAYLRGAHLQGAYLRRADLQGAYLLGADLQGADLQGADLQGAYLQGADLLGAYLRGAYLRGAYLQGAHLRGADLLGADLQGADLQGAKVKRLFASVVRSDDYAFLGFELEAGGFKIAAGCRWFTLAEYHAHIIAQYPGTNKAYETTDILAFIEARAKHLGIV